MPSTSEKQARFMSACAHGWDSDACPPDAVAKKFHQADKKAKEFICKDGCTRGRMEEAKKRAQARHGASLDDIHTDANQAATSPHNDLPYPTPAQLESGNYRKGHIKFAGMDVAIENPAGSERSGLRPDGTIWKHKMSHHYGYIKRTVGADGDHVDVYVGPNEASDRVFVIDQLKDGKAGFDEHKVMLGFDSKTAAVSAYLKNFDPGWKAGPVTEMTVEQFKTWLSDDGAKKPAKTATLDSAAGPSTLERMKLNSELSRLRAAMPGASIGERMRGNKRIAEIRRVLGGVAPVSADPNATLVIAEAVSAALSATGGVVKTGDGLSWALSKSSLNKMIASRNQEGEKPYQRERIVAIQQLKELAAAAKLPMVRPDDGRDDGVRAIYEYRVPFTVNGQTLTARLLCKVFTEKAKRKDKMHSLAMDGVPVNQDEPDGLLFDLDVIGDVVARGMPDRTVPPSADSNITVAEGSTSDNQVPAADPTQPRPSTAQFYAHDTKRSKKKRQQVNDAAIDLLRKVQTGAIDRANLSDEDKATLAAYSGNGGALVGADGLIGSDYEYYTPKPIAEGVWTLMQELGFQGGKVLDPSAGTGIFGATAPPSAAMDAVELDATSGAINDILNGGTGYHVQVAPFEKVAAATPDETYDAVVTNVPFGDVGARGDNARHDQRYRREPLENYFILRSLEKLRPGGLAVFIAPPRCVSGKGGKQETLRIRASYMAEFLGAYRLPNSVFAAAHADTMTDVIAFRKHSRQALDKIDELRAQSPASLGEMNVLWAPFVDGTYFLDEGKRFVLGTPEAAKNRFGKDIEVLKSDLGVSDIAKLMRRFPRGTRIDWTALEAAESAPIAYQDGDTIVHGGQTLQYRNGLWEPLDGGTAGNEMDAVLAKLVSPYQAFANAVTWAEAQQCVEYMIGASRALDVPGWAAGAVSSLAKNLSADQRETYWNTGVVAMACDQVLKERLADWEGVNFLGEYPELSTAMQRARAAAKAVPSVLSWPIKAACKVLCIHAKQGHQFSAVWRGDVETDVEQAALTPEMRFERLKYRAKSSWIALDEARAELGADFDPLTSADWCVSADGRQVIRADDYFVGNYRELLTRLETDIQTASEPRVKDKLLAMQSEAARRVETLDPHRMSFNLRSPYVDIQAKAEFLRRFVHPNAAVVTHPRTGEPALDIDITGSNLSDQDKLTKRFGDWLLNGTITLGGTNLNMNRRDALRELRRMIVTAEEQFDAWVHGNPSLMASIQARANDPKALRFRSTKDGDPLFIPGLHESLKPHPYQYAFIRAQGREFGGGNGFGVGLGKTLSALAAVQHVQNIGVKKKTLFVVPNSVLSNWRKEAVTGAGEPGAPGFKPPVYASDAGCLFVGWRGTGVNSSAYDEDLTAVLENRHSKIFMSYEAFERIRLRDETIAAYEAFMRSADESFGRSEDKKAEERAKGKLGTLMDILGGKDGSAPYLEDMGVDSIVFDEAHALKNSAKTTEFKSARFLSLADTAKRGVDAQAKCWYIRGGSSLKDGVLLLTATPITNSPLEIYSMLTLAVGHERVNDQFLGIKGADAFMEAVCHKENQDDVGIDGTERMTDVFVGIDNVSMLRKAIGETFAIEDAQSVGSQVIVPDRDEQATPIQLPPEINERLQLYKSAFRYAIDELSERKDNRGSRAAYEEVAAHFGEPLSLIGHPFNLINKMTLLIADPELDQRATFFSFPPDQAQQAADVLAKWMKKPPTEKRTRLGPWTQEAAIASRKLVKNREEGTSYEELTIKIEARIDDASWRIVLDTLDAGTIMAFEALAEKNGLALNVTIPPKLAALLENVQIEEAHPRGVTRDGERSPLVKQIVFCDVLSLHPKIRRLLSTQAGIPAGKIAILTGKINNKPEDIIQLQDDFNATGEANKLRAIIANEKAEVGINLQNGTQAIHHLTIGWTPDSLEQRNGRGARQGNLTEQVRIYYYDAAGTFDTAKRTMVNKKADWISQVLNRNGGERVAVTGGLSREQQEILIEVVGDDEAMARAQQSMAEKEAAEQVRLTREKQRINIDTIVKQQTWLKDNESALPMVINKIIKGVLAWNRLSGTLYRLSKEDLTDQERTRAEARRTAQQAEVDGMIAEINDACTITERGQPVPLESVFRDAYVINSRSGKFDRDESARRLKNYYKITINEDGAIHRAWKAEIDMAQAMIDNSLKQFEARAEDPGAMPKALGQAFRDGTADFQNRQPMMPGCFLTITQSNFGEEAKPVLAVTAKEWQGYVGVYIELAGQYDRGKFKRSQLSLDRLSKNVKYTITYPGEAGYDALITRAAEIEDEVANAGEMLNTYSEVVPEVATRRRAEQMVKYPVSRTYLPAPYFPYVVTPRDPQTDAWDRIRVQQKEVVVRVGEGYNPDFVVRSTVEVTYEPPKFGGIGKYEALIDYAMAHGLTLTVQDFDSNGATAIAAMILHQPPRQTFIEPDEFARCLALDSKDAIDAALLDTIRALTPWFHGHDGLVWKTLLDDAQRATLGSRIRELARPKGQDPADDWVAMASDYGFTKVVQIRQFAESMGEQAAWIGKGGPKPYDREVAANLPGAPINTWVVQRKVYTALQEQYPTACSTHHVKITKEQSWT